ncbi:dTDP-4-dehydrorhamnose 3,5-epimerase [Phycicoccus sp. BSK3Z-2]|uniref:dTDP-4-dehydrorhamnose 3,5-epimerase n=1 Tax=Phycicoccus avicenniae TaxID=2828860 RepID=A0A941D8G0_9MICO|nr:dTDP-4-dehydrorhamnose 3,5-epimerase [Phycicoccus avicenniae]MBR7743773.1 dTDP-4-dehydrorhamnose 3,5-epimerase [Phycicoccus avicenniae]
MDITPLAVDGALAITPRQFPDDRGVFLESFRGDRLAEHLGHRPDIVQSNVSVSSRGTLRGLHFAEVPPGQGKFVTALAGSVLDVVVDLRVGSPTFGQWDSVLLDTTDRRAIYVAEGLGHAFLALEDGSTVMYLCTATYAPGREHGVHPLDPALGITWPQDVEPLLSAKDAVAPSLAEARDQGLLPTWDAYRTWTGSLAQREN